MDCSPSAQCSTSLTIEEVLKLPRAKSTDFWKEDSSEDNNSRRDLHWRPQVELLHPDLVHLDFVGRFESLEKDRSVVLDWMYRHTDRRLPDLKQKKMRATNPEDKIQLYQDLRNDIELKDMVLRSIKRTLSDFTFRRECWMLFEKFGQREVPTNGLTPLFLYSRCTFNLRRIERQRLDISPLILSVRLPLQKRVVIVATFETARHPLSNGSPYEST